MARAARDVLLGEDPPVSLTQRAVKALAEIRDDLFHTALAGGTVIERRDDDVRWWTWAGYRANATLASTLSEITDAAQRFDDYTIRLRSDLTPDMWAAATNHAASRLCLPEIDERALSGLKFNEALPQRLAEATLARRLADLEAAARVLNEGGRFIAQ
jgi:ATP-dependent Lhr-like helicase